MKLNKKVIGIVIAVITITACWFIPLSEGLTREALLAIGIFLSAGNDSDACIHPVEERIF